MTVYAASGLRSLIGIAMAVAAYPQGAALPDFEVASVKLHTIADTEPSTTVFPGGRLTAVNLNVRKMLRNAFNVEDYQISGAPHWADSTNYDIEARMPAGVGITRNDIPALLLSLLRTRFQLRYHRETTELTEYALEVSRDGLRPMRNTGSDETSSNTTSRSGIVTLQARKIPMDDLAYALRRQLGRPVTDKTGLSGEFDFDLTWSTEEALDSTVPSLFTVLQKIGLRLVSMKGPVEVVVIEGIEPASDN
jgi:uncharacterized protein (TIGR03435 family)